MKDRYKTKAQLIDELNHLRQRNREGEGPKADCSRLEAALTHARHGQQIILDNLQEHVVFHDAQMRVLWANRAACESAGLSREELTGRFCHEVWAGRSMPCKDCLVTRARKTGQPQAAEKKTPDGRHWHLQGVPILGADGAVAAVVELTAEITEKKRAQEALRRSKERYRIIVETISHGILEIDATGTITYANAALNRLFGVDEDEIIGCAITDFQVSEAAKKGVRRRLAVLVKDRPEATQWMTQIRVRDGRIIDLQVDWNYRCDPQGRVVGFIAVVTDITGRVQALAALKEAHEDLERRVLARTAKLLVANQQLRREIETRQKAEAQARQKDRRYADLYALLRLTIDTVPDLIWAKDLKGRYILANQAICDKLLMCGTPDGATGKTDRFFAERERAAGNRHAFGVKWGDSGAVVKKNKAPLRFLEEVRVRDRAIVLDVNEAPFFNEKGKLIGTVGCARNVTKEKEIETALRKSQSELAAIFENAPVAILLVDAQTRVCQANRKALAIAGRAQEDIIGLPGGQALGCRNALDDPQGCGFGPNCQTCTVRAIVEDTLKTGQAHHEVEAALPLGNSGAQSEMHLLVSTAPLGPLKSEMAVVCLQDITQRKRGQEALKESEERFRRMFEDTVLGLFQGTVDGELLTVNPAFARMFGYETPEGLLSSLGSSALELYANPADRPAKIQLVMDNDNPTETEIHYRHKNGSTFWGQFRVWKVRGEKGRPLYLEGCVENITQRKQAEKSLRESENRLRFLSSRLLAAQENESRRISLEIHDNLAQNMAVLKLQLASAVNRLRKDQGKLKAECQNILKFVDRIIESMRNLSRDLSPSIIEDLKLCATLQWMLYDFEKQSDIALSLEMTGVDDLFSSADQIIIYRIFQEALNNIRKHAEARHVAVEIRKTGGQVVFQIQDDGRGFDTQENWQRHVADRGLGLAAMDERARMLGGTLVITSQRGRGTCLALTIPVAHPPAPVDLPPPAAGA
ncbi:MAG: PAS domain S-box protein [Desulfobacterales bacterium]